MKGLTGDVTRIASRSAKRGQVEQAPGPVDILGENGGGAVMV